LIPDPSTADFINLWRSFLGRFGDRGTQEFELAVAHWAEDPTFIMKTIQQIQNTCPFRIGDIIKGGRVVTIFGDKDGWDIEVKGDNTGERTADLLMLPVYRYTWFHITETSHEYR
jgi:hypothetical protein